MFVLIFTVIALLFWAFCVYKAVGFNKAVSELPSAKENN